MWWNQGVAFSYYLDSEKSRHLVVGFFQYLPVSTCIWGVLSTVELTVGTFNMQKSIAVLFVLVDYDIIKPNMAKESIVELYRYSS